MALSTEDRLSIHELISLHGHLTDDRQYDRLRLLFTDDAAYDVSAYGLGVVQGLDGLTRLFVQRPGTQPVGHHVTNVVIDPDGGDTATVRSKGLAVMADGIAGTVTYDDVVVRTHAGWRIARRTVIPARTD
jgi:3-phenylpropionate/cinnamic acid dioxygenase small subunit